MSKEEFAKMMQEYIASPDGAAVIERAVNAQISKMNRPTPSMDDQFKNPAKVDIGNSFVKGPSNARVTIVEFSDFQCPFCKRGRDTMEQLLEAYPKDVKLVFKNFPLPFHQNAVPASKAAIAAGKQGKFWEMYKVLFDNQQNLNQPFFEAQAKLLNLDVERFKKDMEAPETSKMIDDEKAQGSALGVSGTPAFFINGVKVVGVRPIDDFKKVVDRWLADGKAK
jgi:protein-disulfide isomerase